MPIEDILVHINARREGAEHVDLAGRLAKRFGACLTGLFTQRDIAVLKVAYGRHHDIVKERQREADQAAEAAENRFRQRMAALNQPCAFKAGEGDAADLVTIAARLHDLVVVERTTRETDEGGWDVAETCVLTSGRPTLIVPPGWTGDIGKRIVLAWNDSRESALALHAALPFLKEAAHAIVLQGQPKETFYRFVTKIPPTELATYMKRHCPSVEIRRFEPADADAGAEILTAAKEAGADLVVMGAYGRSRFTEMVLGGATRHVFHHAQVPLLMAH